MKLLKGFQEKIFIPKQQKTVKVFYRTAIVFFSVVFLFCLFEITQLKSEYNVKQFFPKSHALLDQELRVRQEFKLDEKSSLILLVSQVNHQIWLNQKSFNKLKKFTSDIKKISGVKKILSLDTLQGSVEIRNDLYVGNLFDHAPESEWQNIAKNQPFVRPFFLSQNQLQTLIAVELSKNDVAQIENVKKEILKIQNQTGYFNTVFAGLPSLQSEVSLLLKNELLRSVVFGFFIFSFILLLIFQGYSGLLLTLVNLVFVNVVCLGLLSIFKIPFDILLSTLPVLISLGVMSMTVQILIRHSQIHKDSVNDISLRLVQILQTLKELFTENALVSLTTILGFFMLMSSDILIIKKYGAVVSCLVFVSWFLTQLTIIPLSLALPRVQVRTWFSQKAYWSFFIFRQRKSILAVSFVLIVASIFSIFKLNWNTRLFDDLPKNNLSRLNTEAVDRSFGGTLPLSVVIHGTENMWKDPTWISRLNKLSEKLRGLETIGSSISIADLMKKTVQKNMRLPATNQETAESLFLFSMSENDPTIPFLNSKTQSVRIDLKMKDAPSYQIFSDENKISALVKNYFPQQKFEISGMAASVHKMNREMSRDLIFGFWQSIIAIAVFLILVFRSLRWTLVACLPNLIPPLFLISVLATTQTAIKPSIAIIFSIAIGLAFTNTVYVLMRLKKMTRNNLNYLPIKKTMLVEMIPCFLSTLLATSAFMVFLFSYFDMNKLFGAYMIVSLVAGAFGDLVFLPALLATFPQILLSRKYDLKSPAFIIVFLLFGSQMFGAENKLTAAQIFEKSKNLIASKDDSADVTMKIIDTDGSTKERVLSIQRKKTTSSNMTLIRLSKPLDLKGTALLSQIENGTEQQWIYLPSTKQARRVVGANKKGNVLGSELSPQDLDFSTLKAAKATLLKTMNFKNHNYALIEIKSANNETEYTKAIVLISLETYLPMRVEYYNSKNQILKRIEFDQYQLFGGVQRAQSIRIKNLVNKRGTDLALSKIKSNTGLSDDLFSQRALTKE